MNLIILVYFLKVILDCHNEEININQDLTEIESHIETEHQISEEVDKNYTIKEVEVPAAESDNKILVQDCCCLDYLIILHF